MRWVMRVSVVVAILATLGIWLGRSGEDGPPLAGTVAAFETVPPTAAPEITFSDAAGNTLSLDDFAGQVVLLNFWATWCAPCVAEMPALDRLQAALGGRGLAVVALSLDSGGLAAVAPFFAAHGLAALPVYLDPAYATPQAFGVIGLPTTVLIDREGRIVGSLSGPAEWDAPEAAALIAHYLGAAG